MITRSHREGQTDNAMEIVYDKDSLDHYMHTAVQVSNDSPVLLDSFVLTLILVAFAKNAHGLLPNQ
jgi:hypothetical protein